MTDLLTICCQCGLVKQESDNIIYWVRPENVPHYKNYKKTHGYCPSDYHKIMKRIQEMKSL